MNRHKSVKLSLILVVVALGLGGFRPPEHEKSTLEAVFDTGLGCNNCLESVWTWNVPLSRMDYIVDPAEGLWDEPGWKRYFPEGSQGPDGNSRQFLTNLLNLHANTAYLVKLKDGVGDAQLTVSGRPAPRNHRWMKGAYNVAGFPIHPDTSPTVAAFTGDSPITEVRRLNAQGRWEKLADTDTLSHQKAYLVYYDDADPNAPDDYTAPLNILDTIGDGLQFTRGFAGGQQSLEIENLSASEATVVVSLVDATNAGVALQHEESSPAGSTTICDLTQNQLEVTLPAGDADRLEFQVPRTKQTTDGTALLQVASTALGTRWLIPVTSDPGSLAGLWVGDVVVNDVSQARLGATNVVSGALTIGLRAQNESGIDGAVELNEIPDSSTASVVMTTTLRIPEPEDVAPPTEISGTQPFVGGYVFEDVNQNGQRDAVDRGFEGVTVTLGSSTTQTAEDGSYLFEGLTPNTTYDLGLEQEPAGHTSDFNVYLFKTSWEPFKLELGDLNTEDAPVSPSDELRKAFEVQGILLSDAATVKRAANDKWRIEGKGQTFTLFKRTDVLQEVLFVTENPDRLANVLPQRVTVDDQGVTRIEYANDVDDDFPRFDVEDNRVEPALNFGFVSEHDAALWTGTCSERQEMRSDLGPVKNGRLVAELDRASLNSGPDVDDHLLDPNVQYLVYVTDENGNGVACGEIGVGTPTRFPNGEGTEFRYRLLLRVKDTNLGYKTELLPYYETDDGQRVSAPAFSLQDALSSGGFFTDTLKFGIMIDSQDPLNPFKHRYHPDHDNLDVKFNLINFDTVAPHLWEAPQIRRRLTLELTDGLPFDLEPAEADSLKAELDWGGATWGGLYTEVIEGIHKNDITVQGYFIVRQALTEEELDAQDYDD